MTERYQQILQNAQYKEEFNKILQYEQKRIFCRHTMEHFLDVARIMYILSLEEQVQISKDLIYATALLHDIGRAQEYENGIPHEEASIPIARSVLNNCNYSQEEIQLITDAIESHREITSTDNILSTYLYRADKLSRNCFSCPASEKCHWPDHKKNSTVTI